MKTTFFIAPALLIAGSMLSGCSGLDDPEEDNGDPSDFDGVYDFTIIPPVDDEGACSSAKGTIELIDGNVTGSAFDTVFSDTIVLSGSVKASGFISGAFTYTNGGNAGTYDGSMISGTGNWHDDHGCNGTWTAN